MILAGAAATTAQLVGTAIAGCNAQQDAEEPTPPATSAGGEDELAAWAEAARGCLAAGDECMAHCLRLLGEGDTSMRECSQACHQMLAICRAVGTLAAMQSAHAPALAALCRSVCHDCAEACRAHAGHHAECRACMEACERTQAAAAAIAA